VHELPDRAAHGQQLRAVHAPDDLVDHRGHQLLGAEHAEVRRLLNHEARLGELERLHEVLIQTAVGEFHDEIAKRVAMLGDIRCLLDRAEQRQRLPAQRLGVIEAKEGFGCRRWRALCRGRRRALRGGGHARHDTGC